ncbi:MAG: PIN domain-containing protein [Caldilineaceae bacterium]
MMALVDSGFLYATLDSSDKNHARTTHVLANLADELLLPTVVLVETTYLLHARLGHDAMRQFIQRLGQTPLPLISLLQTDLPRVYEVLEQYANLRLDFVDAANVAVAERLNIQRILTVDQRDFRVIRPKHCAYFEILP